ncbi:MAG: coenzyme F420-0:L-glutamate ligase [Acidimicrobiia bacterium]|nr:coenzyme F420-0:L-glutamate ligase [Acidimicrobiia bacterium]
MEIFPIEGIGEVAAGDDVAEILWAALQPHGLQDGDIVVVTHKIVSKAEGKVAPAGSDDEYRAAIEAEAAAIIRRRGDLVITQTKHGFVCANAGVDRSNIDGDRIVLLPDRPDRSAATIKTRLENFAEATIAVVISDTFGRAWRRGLTDVAIGVAGMAPITDLRGTRDMHGRVLEVSEIAIVDEVAAAADLVMGKATGIPAAILRGLAWEPAAGRATDLVRPAHEDMFR